MLSPLLVYPACELFSPLLRPLHMTYRRSRGTRARGGEEKEEQEGVLV